MRIPTIQGTIDRRILVNYRVDPSVLQKFLPSPLRPKLIHGVGLAGICLIRLKYIRPQMLPAQIGISSENAAHRIAVEWEENGERREGVYIPRRDTSSQLVTFVGGRIFPGIHHLATFQVAESDERFHVQLASNDGETWVDVEAQRVSRLPTTSIFTSLEEASTFFEQGSVGYSMTEQADQLDGLELRCANWKVEPLQIIKVRSSFFDNPCRFPEGSAQLDCALLMQNVAHTWYSREPLHLKSA
ncbi:MAG TPA: DUF2071 domain-containing protein [Ktedonosporobacter sp.]|nr:DUF2071 domain-containing protein [Ktedonosporobacter sp.]